MQDGPNSGLIEESNLARFEGFPFINLWISERQENEVIYNQYISSFRTANVNPRRTLQIGCCWMQCNKLAFIYQTFPSLRWRSQSAIALTTTSWTWVLKYLQSQAAWNDAQVALWSARETNRTVVGTCTLLSNKFCKQCPRFKFLVVFLLDKHFGSHLCWALS